MYYATVYEHIRRGVLPTHVPPEVNRSHAAPLDERISDSFLLFNPRKKRPCETGQKCSGTFLLNSPRKKGHERQGTAQFRHDLGKEAPISVRILPDQNV